MYDLSKIDNLHIELSSRCNAACPMCQRAYMGGLTLDFEQTDLPLALLQKSIDPELFKSLKVINYCGNRGDPILNNELLDILEFFHSRVENPKSFSQVIRTNGGIRGTDFWSSLGDFFKGKPGGVIFSVDGLADTNHIYRRGVVWDKLWANMKDYSQTGAPGTWEMLVFDHNKHQIEEVRSMCKDLGFSLTLKTPAGFLRREGEFTPMPVVDHDGNFEYYIYPEDYSGTYADVIPADQFSIKMIQKLTLAPSDYELSLADEPEITCKMVHTRNQSLYINSQGQLFPCCWVNGTENNYPQLEFNRKLEQQLGFDAVDLNIRSVVEIISDPKFVEFFQTGWTGEKKTLICARTCGKKDKTIDNIFKRPQR